MLAGCRQSLTLQKTSLSERCNTPYCCCIDTPSVTTPPPPHVLSGSGGGWGFIERKGKGSEGIGWDLGGGPLSCHCAQTHSNHSEELGDTYSIAFTEVCQRDLVFFFVGQEMSWKVGCFVLNCVELALLVPINHHDLATTPLCSSVWFLCHIAHFLNFSSNRH